MDGDRRTRILIADEQSLFREALCVGLRREARVDVVAEAGNGLQAVTEAERTHPHIAVLDAALPNRDGIGTIPVLRRRVPGCRVLILSDQEDQGVLLRALEAGATGYLPKDRPLDEFVEAVLAVGRGEVVVPRGMLGPLIERLLKRRKVQDDAIRLVSRLSRRERQVLLLLSRGAGNDGIAQSLIISPQTARTHVQNVLGKLRVHSRLEAAALVRTTGLGEELGSDA
jgi:DNA-binding NarL/FixJ family response regulator